MSGTPGETPKIGTPPGINHGYTIERPGDGQLPASQIPCKCELVELTVHVPAYVRDAMQAKAAYTNTTVDAMVTSAFRDAGNTYPLHKNRAYQDPCTYTP